MKFIYTLLLSSLSSLLFAQSDNVIPFVLTEHNNISIPAIINEKDTVNLMFHTANSGLAMTEDGIKKLTVINFEESYDVSSWGGSSSARYSEYNTMQVGQTKVDSIGILEDKHSGPGTDGKFGPDFFGEKIIEIDYDQKQLVIHDVLPEVIGYEKINIEMNRGSFFINAESKVEDEFIPNQFMVHSGYAGTILFDDEFVKELGMNDKLEVIKTSELKDSFGNILKTKRVILPAFKFGAIKFEELPVGIFEGAISRQKMSIFGGDMIKRFNWILDLENEVVYIQANQSIEIEYSSR